MPTNYYFLKLHYDIIDDWKVGTLPDSLKWRFIQCLCVAGECQEGGLLPELNQFAYRIRQEPSALNSDMARLAANQLVELVEMPDDEPDRWFVTNYEKRQEKISDARKQKDYRERQREAKMKRNVTQTLPKRYDGVTIRNTESESESESEQNQTLIPAIAAEFAELLQLWEETFPKKPQPRANNKTLQGKLKTRMKSVHFKENWQMALCKAGESQFLKDGDWFDLSWFLHNDDNYEKCLNGKYKDRQRANQEPQTEHFAGRM